MELLFVGAFVGVVLLILRAAARQGARRTDTLAELATRLGGEHDGASARGTRDGVRVELRFVTRGSGSTSESWTEIDAEFPAAYPLLLHLRRHGWFDRGKIDRGEMVDVQLGDPAFDEAYLVEGAPADVVRAWLDPPARALLQEHGRVELDARRDGGRGLVRLAIAAWLDDVDRATEAIDGAARLAARVREAFAEVERATEAVDAGSPFRPMLDDAPARAAREARHEEVAALEGLRQERAERATAMFWVFLVVVVATSVCVVASSG